MSESKRDVEDTMNRREKLTAYTLKYVFPPWFRQRHLVVLAANEKEALLMRRYLLDEGFED